MQSDDRKLFMSIMTSRHSAELTRRLREHKKAFCALMCIFCLKPLTRSLIHYMVSKKGVYSGSPGQYCIHFKLYSSDYVFLTAFVELMFFYIKKLAAFLNKDN